MKSYTLTPTDLLFFRDARPIETSGGHGARWPEPSLIFDAIHAALHRAFPSTQPWEHAHSFGRSSHRNPSGNRTQRFGSLLTAGLFPVHHDGKTTRWLFPAPADATPTQDAATFLLRPLKTDPSDPSKTSNLPRPLRYPAANFSPPTKDSIASWWSTAAWQSYLAGEPPRPSELFFSSDLFAGEWATGIGIDPTTGTQDGVRIYSAEYLRLRPEVQCGFLATMPTKLNGNPKDLHERISELFSHSRNLIVGGQQRPCSVEEFPTDPLPLPAALPITGTRVKWTLLTPAIFPHIGDHPGGWLPNWICPLTGKVLLKLRSGTLRRVWDETKKRTVRQAESETDIPAHLVAAVVPKPIPITGWTERLHLLRDEPHWSSNATAPNGPRPTHLAVPAGAVYYFEADTSEAAAQLATALNWHGDTPGTHLRNRRSTLLGEKGFGLGLCGTWRPFQDPSDPSHL